MTDSISAIDDSYGNAGSCIALPETFFSNPFFVFCAEVFAGLTGILPNAIRWTKRVYITEEIIPYKLDIAIDNVTRVATLYLHGKIEKNRQTTPFLFLHGDGAHPFSTLGLVDIAQEMKLGPIFSLHLPYDDARPELHRALYVQAIDKIQYLLKEEKIGFKGLTAVGHSKGVTESAYMALVQGEERIKALISFAGRLKPTESCGKDIRKTVTEVYNAILKNQNYPLYTITAEHDWCCRETESTRIFLDNSYVAPGTSHLNVIFSKNALDCFRSYLLATRTQIYNGESV